MNIEEILDEVIVTVDGGISLKLFKRNIVEGDKILELVDEAKKTFPKDFEQAKRITADRNRIIESANDWANRKTNDAEAAAAATIADAEAQAAEIIRQAEVKAANIVEDGRLEMERLISETNVSQEANARAIELQRQTNEDCETLREATKAECFQLTQDAEKWSRDMRTGAYNYAMDIISQVENCINTSGSDLSRVKSNIAGTQSEIQF